jgi:endonuclease/exonuclease/phosphatase (EEP) superfamily protein YafD
VEAADGAPSEEPRLRGAGSLIQGAARVLGWGLLAGPLASLAAVAAGGQGHLLLVLLAALAAWALPVTGVALALFAAARLWRSAAVALAVLLVTLVWLRPFPHGGGNPTGTTVPLTVMTQNVLLGEADPDALVRRVRAVQPDVLVLTELTPQAVARFDAAGLGAALPHRHLAPASGATGTGLYAASPLTETRPIVGTYFNAVEASLELAGHRVTVAAVHPVTPLNRNWAADEVLLTGLLGPRVRAGEPLVVAGDFNATQYHRPFARLLDAGFTDAGQARLWAWQQPSWPVDGAGDWPLARVVPPLIRIDHVLVPRGSGVEWVSSARLDGSDHAGVVARVRLPAG